MLVRWTKARLGCGGAEYEAISRRLLDAVPSNRCNPSWREVEHESAAMLAELGLTSVAPGLPGWEYPARFREVARWGAALGALGVPRGCPHAGRVLREAAAFNVAVALFDTVVDEAPRYLPALGAVLSPSRLADRLSCPSGPALGQGAAAAPIGVVVRLFDYTLQSLGRRMAGDRGARDELSGLLETMYESELRQSNDPFLAKTLPVLFIGRLANTRGDRRVDELFIALGRFIQKWDDFQDLFNDWIHGRANAYLWAPGLSNALPAIGCFVCGCLRLACPLRAMVTLEEDLAAALRQVLEAATSESEPEVRQFLRRLIGGPSESTDPPSTPGDNHSPSSGAPTAERGDPGRTSTRSVHPCSV